MIPSSRPVSSSPTGPEAPQTMPDALMHWTLIQSPYRVRSITEADNEGLKKVLLAVLGEFGCIGSGYSSSDAETQAMSRYYDGVTGQYWVVEDMATGRIVGGGGFNRLKGTGSEEGICELQKLYFLDECRGHGLGKTLIHHCMLAAQSVGYTTMYLETVPQMASAAKLYERLGFNALDSHWGATGHHERCTLRYARTLEQSQCQSTQSAPVAKPFATAP